MNKLVIFDLDGTLLDTIYDIADNINIMLSKFGYPKRSIEEIKQFVGDGARNLVKRSLPSGVGEEKLEECLACYNELYTNSGSPKTRLYGGVDKVLLTLKNRGYKLAVLTNKPQMTTDEVYNKYLSEFHFDCVIGQRADFKIKPNPEAVFYILNKFGARKENVYFVGDGEADVQVALNAGVNSISALWGFREKEQLQAVGANTFAKTPLDIIELIK